MIAALFWKGKLRSIWPGDFVKIIEFVNNIIFKLRKFVRVGTSKLEWSSQACLQQHIRPLL